MVTQQHLQQTLIQLKAGKAVGPDGKVPDLKTTVDKGVISSIIYPQQQLAIDLVLAILTLAVRGPLHGPQSWR